MPIIRVRPWNWLTREEGREAGTLPVETPVNARGYLSMNPWSLRREIDNLFSDAFQHLGRSSGGEPVDGVQTPRADIAATDKEYLISVELPGIEEKDIEVEVHEDVLSIKAQRENESKEESNDEKKNYYRVERHYGKFQRMLHLPEDADAENITANYKNGVLDVKVARKVPQKSEARKISIS